MNIDLVEAVMVFGCSLCQIVAPQYRMNLQSVENAKKLKSHSMQKHLHYILSKHEIIYEYALLI